MKFTALQIAEVLNGTIVGNKDIEVHELSKIEEGKPGTLSFLSNPKYTKYIYTSQASIVVVNDSFEAEKEISCTLIKVKDAYLAFSQLLELYSQSKKQKTGISPTAHISKSAKIGKNAYIGEFVVISDHTVIGDNSHIQAHSFIGENTKIGHQLMMYSGAKIYDGCVIGNNCTFHSGVIIGGDGFGFAPQAGDNYKKLPQIGNVIIEDKVEVGSNTTIDRATLGSTIIREGVKLDNLIQVAHNVEIGKNTVIAAQTGISGTTTIGEYCMIGGQVGIAGHLKIGDKVMIAAQSGIGSSIADNKVIQGSPAFDIRPFTKSYVYFRRLPDIVKRIENIESYIKSQ